MGRISFNFISLLVVISLLQSCRNGSSGADAVIQNQKTIPTPVPPIPPSSQGKSLIGGANLVVNTPLAYTYSVDNSLDPTAITGIASEGQIKSVSIDVAGVNGLLGGVNLLGVSGQIPLLYKVDVSSSSATEVTGLSIGEVVNSVSINSIGTFGLAGGKMGSPETPIAYTIDLSTNSATSIPSLSSSGEIFSVAFDGTTGILGGGRFSLSGFEPFAYLVDASNSSSPIATNIILSASDGLVNSVAIDQTGTKGVIGIINSMTDAAYTVTGTTAHPVIFSSTPLEISSVAINRPGTSAVLGGTSASGDAIAYIVIDFANPVAYDIQGIHKTIAGQTRVAVDSLGVRGLFGGNESSGGFAFVIDIQNKNAVEILLPSGSIIQSVEIQDLGAAGLLGGRRGNSAAAFLLPDLLNSPSLAIQLNLSGLNGEGTINSVSVDAIATLLNHIPTENLTKNNLRLANYLNENASTIAPYFIPAYLEGTLSKALESVAPTRNASALYALNNSFFAIEETVTQRARDARQSRILADSETCMPCPGLDLSPQNGLWAEVIGLNMYHSHQNQTPGFNPWSVGFILGYDLNITQNAKVGTGLGYMYNHLNQYESQGHSTINQEYLSFYTMWEKCGFFANTSLWLGLFQINHVRHIQLSSFDFHQHSFTRGIQFNPHLELGYDFSFHQNEYIVEPFGMIDWIHSWQNALQEFGDLPFRFVQQYLHASVLRAETGFRFYETFRFSSWNLVIQESLSYTYKNPFSIGSVKGFLFGAPGTLILETFTEANHLGSAGLVFLFEPRCTNFPSGTIAYKGEFGSGYQSHLMTLGVEWSF
jgi:outer membrane autotransporter protein